MPARPSGGLCFAFSARWWVVVAPGARATSPTPAEAQEDGRTGRSGASRENIPVGGWGQGQPARSCACQWMGTVGPVSCQRRAGSVAVRGGRDNPLFAFGGGMCWSAREQKEWRLQVCVALPVLCYASRVQILLVFEFYGLIVCLVSHNFSVNKNYFFPNKSGRWYFQL